MNHLARFLVAFLALCQLAGIAASPTGPTITVTVLDSSTLPVPAVRVQVRSGESVVASADTDEKGQAQFPDLPPGRYTVSASKEGFQAAERQELEVAP
ncbi:MAG TPA: carboxypeptidase-like regulatory domain-containing protein, partial [Candidatus Sulfopaludibacter sp.]|nr:carboxypeptidase-like regulatory domain-containing protein [Candidatus Sulfopaludibacter sp.]